MRRSVCSLRASPCSTPAVRWPGADPHDSAPIRRGASKMALKFENEFVVVAPIERTWRTLLDLPRVARCLPGATIEPVSEDGSYQGSMRVKVGPVTMDYKGVATLTEMDE